MTKKVVAAAFFRSILECMEVAHFDQPLA